MEHEVDGDTDCSRGSWNDSKGLKKKLRELEIRGKLETFWIKVKISKNTWNPE